MEWSCISFRFCPQVPPLGGNIGQMQLLRRFIVHIRTTLAEGIRVQNGDSHTFVNQMSNLFLRKWPHCLWPHASLWLWDVFKIQEPAQTNKQPLTWVRFVNYISKLNLYMDTCFKEQPFFFFFLIKGILCQQTESARWWLPPRPASDFSKCAIVQSELCFIDLFHGRGKITSGLLPVRNNNGVLFCCLYFLGQTSVVKIFTTAVWKEWAAFR